MKTSLRGHQVVCSAFIEKNQKVLIVMDPKFKVWRVPGGRAEHGERIEETLIREMAEETGITFKNQYFLASDKISNFTFSEIGKRHV